MQLDRAPDAGHALSKVPQVALAFWAFTILATTVGETAVDALSMTPGTLLFWAAYVLTRPLGATLDDALTRSHPDGGLAVGRITSSLALAAGMVVVIALALRRGHAPAHASPSTSG